MARPQRTWSPGSVDALLLQLLSPAAEPSSDSLAGCGDLVQIALLERARLHHAAVLLAWKTKDLPHVTETLSRTLRRARIASVVHDMRHTRALSLVLSAFREAAIRSLAYKGLALRQALAMAWPTRVSSDIDILVYPDDLDKAETALGKLGYRRVKTCVHEATYGSDAWPPVEIHWSFLAMSPWTDRVAPFASALWRSARVVDLDGMTAPTFNETHTLITLALHSGCHHLCADWASLYEISHATLVWKDRIDWQHVLRMAEGVGCAAALYCVFEITRRHFGAHLPMEVLDHLRPSACRMPAQAIAWAGFQGRLSRGCQYRTRLSRSAWNLLLAPGFGHAVKWVWRRAAWELGQRWSESR